MSNSNNNVATSDQLYAQFRIQSGLQNITLAKYAKYNYVWEVIPESESVNLRKAFNLRDGDWIGIRDEDIVLDYCDDFQTAEDAKVR